MIVNPRITRINADSWIGFGRAEVVLRRLNALMEAPRQARMPGLLVYGSSGIGKTMIARKMQAQYPALYDEQNGIVQTPLLLLQAPPAPDERRFYLHILAAIGAPVARSHTIAELEVRVLNYLRDLGLRMIIIDEVHNLLSGTYREQRRFLNMLRFIANDLGVSLVCFGVNEAVDALRGDVQLARRMDEHFLPIWEDDVDFSRLIQTLISAMQLERPSHLKISSLRRILGITGGVTSRIFTMIKALAVEAIETGEEQITDDDILNWQPTWSRHSWVEHQLHPADFDR